MALCEQVERNNAERTKYRYTLAGFSVLVTGLVAAVFFICWSNRAAYDNGYVQETHSVPVTKTETKTENVTVWVKRTPAGEIENMLKIDSDTRALIAAEDARKRAAEIVKPEPATVTPPEQVAVKKEEAAKN